MSQKNSFRDKYRSQSGASTKTSIHFNLHLRYKGSGIPGTYRKEGLEKLWNKKVTIKPIQGAANGKA